MLKAVLISIGSLVTIFVTVFIYSACVVSSRCNKTMKDYQTDILFKNNLNNKSLNELLCLYEEDGVNFIINDGEIIDYKIE